MKNIVRVTNVVKITRKLAILTKKIDEYLEIHREKLKTFDIELLRLGKELEVATRNENERATKKFRK